MLPLRIGDEHGSLAAARRGRAATRTNANACAAFANAPLGRRPLGARREGFLNA